MADVTGETEGVVLMVELAGVAGETEGVGVLLLRVSDLLKGPVAA